MDQNADGISDENPLNPGYSPNLPPLATSTRSRADGPRSVHHGPEHLHRAFQSKHPAADRARASSPEHFGAGRHRRRQSDHQRHDKHAQRHVRPAHASEHLHAQPGAIDHGPGRLDFRSAVLSIVQQHRPDNPGRDELDHSGRAHSTLSVPSFDGTFKVAQITVELNAAFSPDSGLTAVLIAPNGTKVPLFSGVGGSGANFVNTVFDDSAQTSITAGTAPFTGTFQPTGKLSTLNGVTVDMPNPLSVQWVPGVWTLQLTNTKTGSTGMLDNWSLNITPVITVTPSTQTGTATTFTIGFPLQQLSGTYTVQFGPNILDTAGEALDINQNAGLAVLRNQDQNGPTTTSPYTAADLPMTIPRPVSSTTPGTVSSSITVPDSFVIQGDTTQAGASVMQVQLSLTYPNDPDLTATLYHYDLTGQNLLGQVILFSGVGTGTNTANFNNTVFDDNAGTPIQNGSAPFFATFNPQQSLATVFAPPLRGERSGHLDAGHHERVDDRRHRSVDRAGRLLFRSRCRPPAWASPAATLPLRPSGSSR